MVTTLIIAPELAAPIIVPPMFLVLFPLHVRRPTTTATGATIVSAPIVPVATSTAPSLFHHGAPAPYPCAHAAPAAPSPYAPSPCPTLHNVHLYGRTHVPNHDVRCHRRRLRACSFVHGRRCSVLVLEKKKKKGNKTKKFS